MSIRCGLCGVLGLILLAGCQTTTSPTVDGRPLSLQDADHQYKARLLVLNDGQTTRQEIVSVMGDPDRVADDGHVIMYYWTVKDKENDMLRRSFILCQFNPRNVLTRHTQYSNETIFGGPKLPEDALGEFMAPPPAR